MNESTYVAESSGDLGGKSTVEAPDYHIAYLQSPRHSPGYRQVRKGELERSRALDSDLKGVRPYIPVFPPKKGAPRPTFEALSPETPCKN